MAMICRGLCHWRLSLPSPREFEVTTLVGTSGIASETREKTFEQLGALQPVTSCKTSCLLLPLAAGKVPTSSDSLPLAQVAVFTSGLPR